MSPTTPTNPVVASVAHPRVTGISPMARAIQGWPSGAPLVCATAGVDGRWVIAGVPRHGVVRHWREGGDPIGALDELIRSTRSPGSGREAFPGPGWVIALAYEIGAWAEPMGFPTPGPQGGPGWAWVAQRIEAGLATDLATGETVTVGRLPFEWGSDLIALRGDPNAPRIGSFESSAGRMGYRSAVARAREYIRAGDIFQANLAHRLSAPAGGHPRVIAAQLFHALHPRFGAYLEIGQPGKVAEALISMSPELFLDVAPAATPALRRVVTRPIKGTARQSDELRTSAKDAAELAMIVDLMRNDLGRIAQAGSVRVEDDRSISLHHGGRVAHAEASVSAVISDSTSLADLLRASFPPGSVTGAPKVRALQIIEQLERPMFGGPRGAYCGAMGYVGDDGRLTLNVAIRTLTWRAETGAQLDPIRGMIDLPVGAGIVADSEPDAEWRETIAKARPMVEALGADFGASFVG